MTTIKEDYVSFEIAKLLKEKGFPQEYDIYHSLVYNEEDYEYEYEAQRMVLETKLMKAGTLFSYPIGVPEPKCYCCTVQMAMKWLREAHNIFIQVELYSKYNNYWFELFQNTHRLMIEKREVYNSYEQAAEAAIKYCLENLI